MEHIYTRPLRTFDKKDLELCDAAFNGSNAYYPEGAFTWPSTRVIVAEKCGRPILYQPIFSCYMLGSLGKVAGATDNELASAQHQMTATMFYESQKAGNGELLFLGGNEQTEAFALRHQYERYPHSIFRLKVL